MENNKQVIFVTNLPIFHQIGMWDVFYNLALKNHVDFTYLCTGVLDNERLKMNYSAIKRDYIKHSKDFKKNELINIFKKCDLCFTGSIEDNRMNKLVYKSKNVCFISEHHMKNQSFRNKLGIFKYSFEVKSHTNRGNRYLFAISRHCFDEFMNHNIVSRNNIYKFGYFPILENYTKIKKTKEITFVGRLIDWKNPSLSVLILKEFLKHDSSYKLNVIGEGLETEKVKALVKKEGLEDCVNFYNFLNHEEVIKILAKSKFGLFTSNSKEGWGAVLNEMMYCGAVPIASSLAGATDSLVKNSVNGFVFENPNQIEELVNEIFELDQTTYVKISEAAQNTINELWNNKIAGERTFDFAQAILKNKNFTPYIEGPLSRY